MTPRDLMNAGLNRATLAALWLRLVMQRRLRLTHDYQPDPFNPASDARDRRSCAARYTAMAAALPKLERPSVLDIGCNQGYFTFRLAERGGLCLGVDADRNEIMAARAIAALHGVRNVAFFELLVDRDVAGAVPEVDVVLCLSIYHHWVRILGRDHADAIMKALALKARHALVFETGQPEEAGARWTGDLSFMTPDSNRWIGEFLADLGFARVERVGGFPTTVSPTPRQLFVALRG